MLDISNEQAMLIRIVTDQSNRRSTSPTKREFVGSVDAQPGSAIRSRNVSVPFGRGSVDILDVSARWITSSEEVELVKEALRFVFVDELVRRDCWCTVSITENTIWSTLRRYKGENCKKFREAPPRKE